ncbi:MerR family transcriptional regulator [Streptomyces sp. NPDC050418]|uniref:MerR family transcriptional regulator n=1 Tax=Streptomyces sp. NPDC050418 TaxID=3365612 RepID=UPI0037AE9012
MAAGWDGSWSIGELAEYARTTVKTVRFYSDRGLLPERDRSGGGHRRYGPEALERLRLIRSLRGLGVPLPDVQRIVAQQEEGDESRALEDAVAGQLRTLGSQLAALRWQEAALRLVHEAVPEERPDRLQLVGALASPPSTAPLARFWRAWLPARMPARATSAFLEVAVPQPPESPTPGQVLAFARLNALVTRPCSAKEPTQPAAHGAAGPREAALLYAGLAEAYGLAAPDLLAGRAPHDGEALAAFVDTYATVHGLRDTPAFRRRLARELGADPRFDGYWELVAEVATPPGERPHPTPGTAHDWLVAALEAGVGARAA